MNKNNFFFLIRPVKQHNQSGANQFPVCCGAVAIQMKPA